MTLVGIVHAGPNGLALANVSEITIEIFETGLHLLWLSADRIINAAYSSVTETEFLTYQEYEARLMDVPTDAPTYIDELKDLEDHSF